MTTEDLAVCVASGGLAITWVVFVLWIEFKVHRETATTFPVWPRQTCGNCRWYSGNAYSGCCVRRSPVLHNVGDDGVYVSKWPDVSSESWCGQHEYKIQQESESAK